jgi:hypothetical protein
LPYASLSRLTTLKGDSAENISGEDGFGSGGKEKEAEGGDANILQFRSFFLWKNLYF